MSHKLRVLHILILPDYFLNCNFGGKGTQILHIPIREQFGANQNVSNWRLISEILILESKARKTADSWTQWWLCKTCEGEIIDSVLCLVRMSVTDRGGHLRLFHFIIYIRQGDTHSTVCWSMGPFCNLLNVVMAVCVIKWRNGEESLDSTEGNLKYEAQPNEETRN